MTAMAHDRSALSLVAPAEAAAGQGGPLVLLSHHGCPYVQRVAIVLAEKGVAHERRDIELHREPKWFLDASPLGLIPVLLVDGQAIFKSLPICEYLDEVHAPVLHRADPVERAADRAWMLFMDGLLQAAGGFFKAKDESTMEMRRGEMIQRLLTLESRLGHGPYFHGAAFGMVDVVAASALRYFDAFVQMEGHDYVAGRP